MASGRRVLHGSVWEAPPRKALNKVGGGGEGRASEAVPSRTHRDVFCSLQRLERLPPTCSEPP
jgi:hypothetical protein